MTEYEKMVRGEIYDSSEKELLKLRGFAHSLCMKYNKIPEKKWKKRERILKKLIPNQKENLYLQGPIQFDYGKNISFGKNCYANFNLVIIDCANVEIGDDVFFGPNCAVVTAVHPMSSEERRQKTKPDGTLYTTEYAKPVKIGSGTWLATNVTVCGGVTIGENCVIGAGSVVTRDIPPNSFAAGIPCKVIKNIENEN